MFPHLLICPLWWLNIVTYWKLVHLFVTIAKLKISRPWIVCALHCAYRRDSPLTVFFLTFFLCAIIFILLAKHIQNSCVWFESYCCSVREDALQISFGPALQRSFRLTSAHHCRHQGLWRFIFGILAASQCCLKLPSKDFFSSCSTYVLFLILHKVETTLLKWSKSEGCFWS